MPVGIPVSESSFSAMAATNLDKDAFVDVWGINDRSDIRNRGFAAGGGWGPDGNDIAN